MNRIDMEVSGGCQCGAVRYHSTQILDNSHLCHCRMCQKASGSIFAGLVAAPDETLVWTRGKPAIWRSSDNVERGFCVNNGRTNLMIGSLDNPNAFPPGANTGTEGAVTWFQTITSIEDGGATETDREAWASAIKATNHQHPDHDTPEWQATPRQQ